MNEDMYRELPQRTAGYKKKAANGLAVASLVMGILAIVTSFFMIGIMPKQKPSACIRSMFHEPCRKLERTKVQNKSPEVNFFIISYLLLV